MATSEEVIERLLFILNEIGFTAEETELQLRSRVRLNLPRFKLEVKKEYGKEALFFELQFSRNSQEGFYNLDGYEAVYRNEIAITPEVINGVDIANLEGRMRIVDWDGHYNGKDKAYGSNDVYRFGEETIALLGSLGGNEKGIKVQDLLMYKYWPSYVAGMPAIRELQKTYERRREFPVTGDGPCNANLAFHILSGRLDELYVALSKISGGRFPAFGLQSLLEENLSLNRDAFTLRLDHNTPEGFAIYQIPITKTGDRYTIDAYTLSLTLYPPVSHGVFNGVDTAKLEESMRDLDWNNDRHLFHQEKEEVRMIGKTADIKRQMLDLWNDPAASDIADLLALKYWQSSDYFSSIVPERALETMALYSQRDFTFNAGIESRVAMNLLAGRAVPMHIVYPDMEPSAQWIKLNLEYQASKKDAFIEIAGVTQLELIKLLNFLPLHDFGSYDHINSGLIKGDLVRATFSPDVIVLLEADPGRRIINVYTQDRRPIPVNLFFDPEWTPETGLRRSIAADIKENQQKKRPPFTHGKRSGV